MTAECNMRTRIKQIQNTIRSENDHKTLMECFKEIKTFLPKDIAGSSPMAQLGRVCGGQRRIVSEESDLFMRYHYAKMANFLIDSLSVDKYMGWTKDDYSEYFLSYFLEGCDEEAFLAVTNAIRGLNPGFKLNKCVLILEEFLRRHNIMNILSEQSGLHKDPEMSMILWKEDGRALFWDTLVTEIASLPDKMANKLKNENSELFLPKHYLPLLTGDILKTLATVCKYVRLSRDCSLEFVSRLVGKLCMCGYAEPFWDIVLKHVSVLVQRDFIWSRVIERVVTGVPDRCVESVLVPLVRNLSWYGLMDRFLGSCVTQKQKAQLLLCTKLVFHRYFKSAHILQNIIGYLATSTPRQHLFIKLLYEIVQVWGDHSSVSHMGYEQHFYITEALVLCMTFITEAQRKEHKDEILRLVMPGVQTHIGFSDTKLRRLGMFVAELVTATVDPEGPKLNFEYDRDDEIATLTALKKLPEDPGFNEMELEGGISRLLTEEKVETRLAELDVEVSPTPSTKASSDTQSEVSSQVASETVSELDSDDDLEPYDMSNDVKISKQKKPKYIRDCMEGLIGCDNPDTLEVWLSSAENLIRGNPDGLKEISVEFTKVLLHLTESYGLPGFRGWRFNALVALAVMCPRQVAEYLTEQFYDRNFSIRQRLDIVEVVGTAAQELSRPHDGSSKTKAEPKIQELRSTGAKGAGDVDQPDTWREIVQRRIDSKTRRFGQGRKHPEPVAVANKFAPVAGYFFYPLMKNFDKQENTFDLMGEDCYVLSRLMYTLGIVMYAASNIPTVCQMASCLLEFIWILRFHQDKSVRQGLLFAISMVYLAVPPHLLLNDLQQEVFESKNWLEDIIDKDEDTQCKTLAVQALVLLENIIKQEFLSDT